MINSSSEASYQDLSRQRAAVTEMTRGIERYNPGHIQILEEYILRQCQNPNVVSVEDRERDLEINLCLLKLYLSYPDRVDKQNVLRILLLALANLPQTDFLFCKALLSEDILSDPDLADVLYLADLLETCNFQTFWTKFDELRHLSGQIAGFQDCIRMYACHVISITFEQMTKTSFNELLHLQTEEEQCVWSTRLAEFKDKSSTTSTSCKQNELDKDNLFVCSQEHLTKTRKITEKIKLNSVAQILASSV